MDFFTHRPATRQCSYQDRELYPNVPDAEWPSALHRTYVSASVPPACMFEAIYIEIDARAPASSAGSTRRAIRGPAVAMAPLAFDGADVDEVEAGEVELELELELELPEVSESVQVRLAPTLASEVKLTSEH